MLADGHFGHDDPLYHPQPFDTRVPHLALIRFPSTGNDHILWLSPSTVEFERTSQDASSGLGVINAKWVDLLRGVWKMARDRLSKVVSGLSAEDATLIREDRQLSDFVPRLKYLFGRFTCPASFDESLMTWRMTQRIILEFDARLTWFLQAREPYYHFTGRIEPLLDVIGALTDRLEEAESLYRVSPVHSLT